MNFRAYLYLAASTLALSVAAQAHAADAAAEGAAVSEVVVTGSRLVRNGNESPTPVTVTTAAQLELAAPTNISDGLNQLPQFRGSTRPQAGGVSANGSPGANLLNLRNLGPQRNLILLDGRRVVPSTGAGVVDTNTLPQGLVQRVDVVTGGASAAYGSDAVAGVVNFILDTKFEGLKGSANGGISSRRDSGTAKLNLTFGHAFADDRAHFIGSFDYSSSDGLGPYAPRRDWNTVRAGIIPNVPATAQPGRLILTDNVTVSAASFGGLIMTGPLAGTQFGPGGTVLPFQFGTTQSSTFMVGGDGPRNDANMSADLARYSLFGHVTYDLTDDLHAFVEAGYANAKSDWDQYYNYAYTTNAATVFSGNPFIPAALQAAMTSRNIASVPIGRIFSDGGNIGAVNETKVSTFAAGFNGDWSGWRFNGATTYGESKQKIGNTHVLNNQNYYAAVDAVRDPATGNVVCRSTLLFNINPGCVPINLFGVGAPSAAAIAYIEGDEYRYLRYTQFTAAVGAQRDLFKLWSDAVSVAVGAEYRHETANQTTDAITSKVVDFTNIRGGPTGVNGGLGPFIVGNPQPVAGKITVKEAYAEIQVPILKDAPLADLLEFNGAVRATNYESSGTVTTWKAGVIYKPFADLRLRATRSRDIRAANIAELYTGATQSIGTIRDPSGLTQSFVGKTTGNPALDPERADTLTYGVVYEPSWAPGLSASVDAYNIVIEGAIASLSAQGTVDECRRGSSIACGNIQIVGGVYRITLPNLNLNSLKTVGIDAELGYSHEAFGGNLTLRALGNYQPKLLTTTPGTLPIDRAGEVGQSANPMISAVFSANYVRGPWSGFLQERYTSKGRYNNTFAERIDINDNSIPAAYYTDLTLRREFEIAGGHYDAYVTINNLFDKDPPLAPSQSGTHLRYTNFDLYDTIGRFYTVGFHFKY